MAPDARPATAPAVATFEEALRKALEIAALSPSSHNCQPWAIAGLSGHGARRAASAFLDGGTVAGGDNGHEEAPCLALALDRGRRLDALPAHAVEMLLSCGLYWQILLRALAAQGWVVDRSRFRDEAGEAGEAGETDEADEAGKAGEAGKPQEAEEVADGGLGAGWPPDWSLLCVARFCRGGAPAADLADIMAGGDADDLARLRAVADARRTNRAPYRVDPVDPAVLDRLLAPSAAAAEAADVTVRHLRTAGERARFADFVARHGGRDFSHGGAWRETHSYLRWSREDAEARGDGFTLGQLFGPLSRVRHRCLRIALAPATMRVLRYVGYHRVLAGRLARVVRPTPVIVAMGFADGAPGPGATVRAGARLADYWLRATAAGLVLHPVSVVLQHEDLRSALQAMLGLPGRAFFVSRLGHPTTGFPRSPRRAAASAFRTI